MVSLGLIKTKERSSSNSVRMSNNYLKELKKAWQFLFKAFKELLEK